ncbi:MAG: twin-arginine translocation signal domain-containing protein, partial [Acidobacteria bacterium]|nr:twin-arginine translocation signal domain-containing protein [Acidobacteriota bacterium]
MNRRDFLKTSSAAVAGLALTQDATPQPASSASPGRLVLRMNRNWRFSPQR